MRLNLVSISLRLHLTMLTICCLLLISCQEAHNDNKSEVQVLSTQNKALPENLIDVLVLDQNDFQEQLISNGKLKAKQQSILTFEVSGTLKYLKVTKWR